MKITRLIKQLISIRKKYGEIEVIFCDQDGVKFSRVLFDPTPGFCLFKKKNGGYLDFYSEGKELEEYGNEFHKVLDVNCVCIN